MKKSFAVLGLGRFGLKLIEELSHHNADIIAIDTSEENVSKASEFVSNAFVCDATNENALKELGVGNVDHAIIAFGSNLQATILSTIILKEMGINKITVRVDDDYYVKVIKKLGATDVISPQRIAGIRLANKIISDTFIDYFNISSDFCIVEISVNENVMPLNISDINPRNNFEVNLLLIQRGDNIFSPKGTDDIMPKDMLYIFGTRTKISKFDHFVNTQVQTEK
jgi:trk system potassium uptake protein TrkA